MFSLWHPGRSIASRLCLPPGENGPVGHAAAAGRVSFFGTLRHEAKRPGGACEGGGQSSIPAILHLAVKKVAGRAEFGILATLRRAAKSAWASRVAFSLTLRLKPNEAGAGRIASFATLQPSRRKRPGGARDGAAGRVIFFVILCLAAKGAPGGQRMIFSYSALRGGRSPGTRQGARGEAAGRVAFFATLRLAAKGAPGGQSNIYATLRRAADGVPGGQNSIFATLRRAAE